MIAMTSRERRGRSDSRKGASGALEGQTRGAGAGLRGLSYAGALERVAPGSAADPEAAASWQEVLAGVLVLEQGQSGPAVRLLQQKLADAGRALRPSGVFGPSTAALVREVQAAAGLEPDGRVDARTAAALDAG